MYAKVRCGLVVVVFEGLTGKGVKEAMAGDAEVGLLTGEREAMELVAEVGLVAVAVRWLRLEDGH